MKMFTIPTDLFDELFSIRFAAVVIIEYAHIVVAVSFVKTREHEFIYTQNIKKFRNSAFQTEEVHLLHL